MSLVVEIYSEKAIVLRGAQDCHKSVLEANKGMFNARLKNGAGWIFPKFMKTQIEALAEQINSGLMDLSAPSSSSSSSSKSAEPEVSKKEFLALMTRVERLEALVAQLTGVQFAASTTSKASSATSVSASNSAKSSPPLLSDLPAEDLELDFEEEDEVMPPKRLSKPAPTVQSVTSSASARKSFSKPKVNP
jgi:hypothetical protein